jgi:hypothetical protein
MDHGNIGYLIPKKMSICGNYTAPSCTEIKLGDRNLPEFQMQDVLPFTVYLVSDGGFKTAAPFR